MSIGQWVKMPKRNSFSENGQNLLRVQIFCPKDRNLFRFDFRYMASSHWLPLCDRNCQKERCFVLFHFPEIISGEIELPLIDWAVDGSLWEGDILSFTEIRE